MSKQNLNPANGRVIFHTSIWRKLRTRTTIKQLHRMMLPTVAPTGSRRASRTLSWPVMSSLRGMYFLSLNVIARATKQTTLQAAKGRIMYAVKAALLIPKPSQITTLVGFPTNSTMLAVLAAANSDINHGRGSK